ncbi:MAG: hypothetical protein ACJA0P_002530 [Planctomycetota bacterium]|jgi:hypothetical protein
MKLSRLSVSTLTVIAASILAYSAQPASADGISASQSNGFQLVESSDCFDTIQASPVVMMASAGATLLGPQMSSIAIYSNGLVILSEASGATGGSAAAQAVVGREQVQDLQRELRGLGAFRICDDQKTVADIPLTTVTVFHGEQSARAHSYSYWIGTEEHQRVRDALQSFILEHVYRN